MGEGSFLRALISGAAIGMLSDRSMDARLRVRGEPELTEVAAEIAGSVWKIECQVGDRVEVEEVLLILESMKMEIPVESPCAGTVQEIRVSEGDSIDEDAVLVLIQE